MLNPAFNDQEVPDHSFVATRVLRDKFSISFVRNPFSLLFSNYNFCRHNFASEQSAVDWCYEVCGEA
jgi:hypothetical protein